MREIFADRIELDGLSQLAEKRSRQAMVHAQNVAGTQALQSVMTSMATATANGSTTTTPSASSPADSAYSDAASIGDDPGGIVNRSPVTTNNYHYYPQTTTTTTPTTVTPTPTTTPTPAPTSTKTGISPWWWLLLIPLLLGLGGLTWYLTKKPTTPATPPPAWTGQTTIKLGDAP